MAVQKVRLTPAQLAAAIRSKELQRDIDVAKARNAGIKADEAHRIWNRQTDREHNATILGVEDMRLKGNLAEAKSKRPGSMGSLFTGAAAAAHETRMFSKWIWPLITTFFVVLLIAGPGLSAVMQLAGGLGYGLWVLIILALIIVWRYK